MLPVAVIEVMAFLATLCHCGEVTDVESRPQDVSISLEEYLEVTLEEEDEICG